MLVPRMGAILPERVVFAARTPLCYRVVLARNRWREIVRFKHPALRDRDEDLIRCVEDPDIIRESVKDPNVHLLYRREGELFLCVVAAPSAGEDRFVVTAYVTRNIKQGNTLWTK